MGAFAYEANINEEKVDINVETGLSFFVYQFYTILVIKGLRNTPLHLS